MKSINHEHLPMKSLIRIEELSKLIAAYWGSLYLGYSWWIFPALLFVPDLSMAGYLINSRAGAALYNVVHHQALAIVIGIMGFYYNNNQILLVALILFGHSALDRALGYGLKYAVSFHHTHLGQLGKDK